jgi:hypothetical protein
LGQRPCWCGKRRRPARIHPGASSGTIDLCAAHQRQQQQLSKQHCHGNKVKSPFCYRKGRTHHPQPRQATAGSRGFHCLKRPTPNLSLPHPLTLALTRKSKTGRKKKKKKRRVHLATRKDSKRGASIGQNRVEEAPPRVARERALPASTDQPGPQAGVRFKPEGGGEEREKRKRGEKKK